VATDQNHCIENSIKPKEMVSRERWVVSFVMLPRSLGIISASSLTLLHFSIQFSIENHSKWQVSGELYFIFKISKLTIQIFFCLCQFEWILLLKKVKFVSRTLFSYQLQTTSRYNFLSKITRSDSLKASSSTIQRKPAY
jgi:hypothetical protein